MNLSETFTSLSTESIAEYIENQQEEHLQLEFKTINDPRMGRREDRRNLAICISGFANSMGGIIVWGVDARPDAEDIDCAVAAVEIQNLRQFLSKLNEFSSPAASPPVDGILHRTFETRENIGFAATLVPESTSGPHMAKLGEDRYYKRNGSRFYRLEHFDLADMFGRRQRPELNVLLSSKSVENSPGVEELTFRLSNTGRALAKHVGFFARLHGATVVSALGKLEDVTQLNEGRASVSYAEDQDVFHPTGILTRVGRVHYRRNDPSSGMTVAVTYYCEHMQSKSESIELSPEPTGVLQAPTEPPQEG